MMESADLQDTMVAIRMSKATRDSLRSVSFESGLRQGDVIRLGLKWVEFEWRLREIVELPWFIEDVTEEAKVLLKTLEGLRIDLDEFLREYREEKSLRAREQRRREEEKGRSEAERKKAEEARRAESDERRKRRISQHRDADA